MLRRCHIVAVCAFIFVTPFSIHSFATALLLTPARSLHRLCLGKLPCAVQNLWTPTVEAHRIVPIRHYRNAPELSSQPPNSAGLLDFHRVLEIAPLLHVGGIVGVHQDPESSNLTGLRNIRDAIPFPRTPDNVDF
jgi:hypothetical protein